MCLVRACVCVFCFFSFKVVVPIGVGMALGSVPAVAAWRNGGGKGDAEKRFTVVG